MDVCMVVVQPLFLSFRQEALVDKFAAIRNHCDVLETQVRLVPEFVLGLDFLHHHNILDPNSKRSIFIVAGFI